jgi:hypothetical protein
MLSLHYCINAVELIVEHHILIVHDHSFTEFLILPFSLKKRLSVRRRRRYVYHSTIPTVSGYTNAFYCFTMLTDHYLFILSQKEKKAKRAREEVAEEEEEVEVEVKKAKVWTIY